MCIDIRVYLFSANENNAWIEKVYFYHVTRGRERVCPNMGPERIIIG